MVRVIVEGNDDKNFIIKLLTHLKDEGELTIHSRNLSSYIEVIGSKSKLLNGSNPKYRNLSRLIEVGKILRVLFIFDSDFESDDRSCNGVENSKRCVEELILSLDWKIDVDFYIFNRNLDYFLIDTIKEKKCYFYFNNLMECLDIEKFKPNRKPIANLYRELYPYPQFDFRDNSFNELKQKLKNLFKGLEK